MGGKAVDSVSKHRVRLYHWKYDDGSIQYVLKGKMVREALREGICQDRQAFQEIKTEIKKKVGSDIEFASHKWKIPCGLTAFEENDEKRFSLEQDKQGFKEFQKLLDCCGKEPEERRTVMELVSGILAGYCARIICQNDEDSHFTLLSQRAPIIQVSGNDQTFDVLAQIVCALAVDTSASDHKLQLENPRVLPPQIAAFSTDQCAYLTFREKPHRYATQYRDTAVLIHGFFFKKSDVIAFARRNCWASLVLFRCKEKEWGISTLSPSGKVLRKAELSWNARAIQGLIRDYLHWLAQYDSKEERNYFTNMLLSQITYAEKDLYRYVLHSKQKLGSSRFGIAMLQLLALRLFMLFCMRKNIVAKEEGAQLLSQWEEWLFDGCRQGAKDEPTEPPETPAERFQKMLSNMIRPENAERFLFVGDDQLFDQADPDRPAFRYWGYCRMYEARKGDAGSFPALIIRRRDFEEIAREIMPSDKQIQELFAQLDGKKIAYIHAKKARFKVGIEESKSEDAYVLNISKMNFLTAEQRALLLKRFPSDSIKT